MQFVTTKSISGLTGEDDRKAVICPSYFKLYQSVNYIELYCEEGTFRQRLHPESKDIFLLLSTFHKLSEFV